MKTYHKDHGKTKEWFLKCAKTVEKARSWSTQRRSDVLGRGDAATYMEEP
jgi:hypothetical protein